MNMVNFREEISMPLSDTLFSFLVNEYKKIFSDLSFPPSYFMLRVVEMIIANSSPGNQHEND